MTLYLWTWLRRKVKRRYPTNLQAIPETVTVEHDLAHQNSEAPPSYESLYCVGPTYYNLGGAYDPVTPVFVNAVARTANKTTHLAIAVAAAAPAAHRPAVAAAYARLVAEDSYLRADRLVGAHPESHAAAGEGFAHAAASAAAASAVATVIAAANAGIPIT
jgi:hypothetical protein